MKVTPFLVAMVSVTLIIPSCVAFAGLFQLADHRYRQEFCRSVDGDTINCGGEAIRLNGIDAPEKHGCPAYRNCAPGDPYLSEASLQVGLDQGDVVITETCIGLRASSSPPMTNPPALAWARTATAAR